MVEEILAARGVDVTYDTIRRWADKFGREFARQAGAAHTQAAPKTGTSSKSSLGSIQKHVPLPVGSCLH